MKSCNDRLLKLEKRSGIGDGPTGALVLVRPDGSGVQISGNASVGFIGYIPDHGRDEPVGEIIPADRLNYRPLPGRSLPGNELGADSVASRATGEEIDHELD
jgi:hypothetical protein